MRPARPGPPPAWTYLQLVNTVTLEFTRPPGVNNLYINARRGRIISAAYRAWLALAMAEIGLQRPGCVRGPFHWSLAALRTSRRQDLDGIYKAILDVLQKSGVIQNDNLAQSDDHAWTGRGTTVRVRVTSTKEVWHERT